MRILQLTLSEMHRQMHCHKPCHGREEITVYMQHILEVTLLKLI